MATAETAQAADDDTHHLDHLKRCMDERRQEFDLPWKGVARRADVSEQMLRAILRGERNPSSRTKRALERALSWETGSFDEVCRGGAPQLMALVVREADPNPWATHSDPTVRSLWALTWMPESERVDYIEFHLGRAAMPEDERAALTNLLRARRRAAGA